jgi:hypothetical protein
MWLEHCAKYGHGLEFTMPNYCITTTPEKEWAVVVLNKQTNNMGHGRRLRPLADVMKEEIVREAGLCEEEAVAVILYTGPMVSSLGPNFAC